ncbi:MAG: radical SAM protein [Calditrichaeota bacterium]|nr:radical SAM protein [Calditrichota bacterium]
MPPLSLPDPTRLVAASEKAIPRRGQLLRLAVTDRCDFRCLYCAPPGGLPKTPYNHLPTLDELAEAVRYLTEACAIRRVKITGGEPLLRPGVVGLVERLAAYPHIEEVSLTTNGSKLARLAQPLREAGLARVNVSLDTLDPERFTQMTGGRIGSVLAGIDAAIETGLKPVKLNAVLTRSHWREDVPALIRFAGERGVEVRFIELMSVGPAAWFAAEEFISAREVRSELEGAYRLEPVPGRPGAPARRMRAVGPDGDALTGWITPQSHSFCDHCDRLRLDCHGRLRRCLMDPIALPLLIMSGEGRKAKCLVVNEAALEGYLAGKRAPDFMAGPTAMIAIGG